MVGLELWAEGDLEIARRFLSDPRMMTNLGGVQSNEEIEKAHQRWLNAPRAGGAMYKIVVDGDVVGTIGYWEKDWQGEEIYETGWSVFPEHQGRGIALQATLAIIEKTRAGTLRSLHAFPHVDNAASNKICEKAGFKLLGPVEFEYPPGNFDPSNDWVLSLR